jgi:transcriptional regulator with XRE-family HTH domain
MCLDLGFSKSTLSNMKNGRTANLSTTTMKKMAEYLGVTVGYLLGEEEQKEKPTAQGDELSEKMLELFNRVKELPEEKVELLLQVARSIKQQDR